MTHADAHNILQAIIAEPDDDLHRLAYADWCEENDQPERAEFIRLQIALWNEQRDCNCGSKSGGHTFKGGQHHNGPCAASQLRIEIDGKWKRAESLAYELWVGNCRKWVGIGENHHPLECLTTSPNQYARGFIRKVECTHDIWVDHGKKICPEHPIEDVRLVDKKPRHDPAYGDFVWRSLFPEDTRTERSWDIQFCIYKYLLRMRSESDTEEAAYAAISKACIAYGRSK